MRSFLRSNRVDALLMDRENRAEFQQFTIACEAMMKTFFSASRFSALLYISSSLASQMWSSCNHDKACRG